LPGAHCLQIGLLFELGGFGAAAFEAVFDTSVASFQEFALQIAMVMMMLLEVRSDLFRQFPVMETMVLRILIAARLGR